MFLFSRLITMSILHWKRKLSIRWCGRRRVNYTLYSIVMLKNRKYRAKSNSIFHFLSWIKFELKTTSFFLLRYYNFKFFSRELKNSNWIQIKFANMYFDPFLENFENNFNSAPADQEKNFRIYDPNVIKRNWIHVAAIVTLNEMYFNCEDVFQTVETVYMEIKQQHLRKLCCLGIMAWYQTENGMKQPSTMQSFEITNYEQIHFAFWLNKRGLQEMKALPLSALTSIKYMFIHPNTESYATGWKSSFCILRQAPSTSELEHIV